MASACGRSVYFRGQRGGSKHVEYGLAPWRGVSRVGKRIVLFVEPASISWVERVTVGGVGTWKSVDAAQLIHWDNNVTGPKMPNTMCHTGKFDIIRHRSRHAIAMIV